MPGIQTLHLQPGEQIHGVAEGYQISPGEIIPSEGALGKNRITGKEQPPLPVVQADAAWSMPRGVEYLQLTNPIPPLEEVFREDGRRPFTEHQSHALPVIPQPGGVQAVDPDLRIAEMGNFLGMGSVIIVAMGEHDPIHLLVVGFQGDRRNPCIDQKRSEQIGIR